jgi:membrane-associated protein
MDFIIDFILHIDEHLEYIVNTYHLWTYAIIFLIIFCETGLVVTPFLPGDSLIFAAGAIAAREGIAIDVHLLALVLFAAAVIGDTCNYEIGRFFGQKLFSNPNSKIFKQEYLEKTHNFYRKYGGKTIIIARFVPIVRTFAPFVAGMGKMHYTYFISYNVIGGAAWVAIFCYVGYFFGNVPFVQQHFGVIAIAIIIISVLPAIIEVIREQRKIKKAKAE